ncbi:MAG TPA: DNA adenine methylase [Thiobacillus sp.]|jgi:DNA adenine methylase|nr:DNA adenine methylase [Thiobacillus sp.]
MKSVPHAIPYQGSKRNLASEILHFMPEHTARLIEPFAGSAAISLAAAARGMVDVFLINDLNKPLVELLKLVVEKPLELSAFYERLWNEQHKDSLEHYYSVREDFNRTHDPRLFLYLLARCVKGSVRYNSDGLFNQSPDKRRYGTRPETMRGNVLGVSTLLKNKTTFSSLDYRELLSEATPDDVVYMDPPYQGVCGNRDARYFSGITHDAFVDALQELDARGVPFLVSYDGRRGDRTFGEPMPEFLGLTCIELMAGRSTQSTLLGRDEVTVESLYLSRALTQKHEKSFNSSSLHGSQQYALLEPSAHYG